MTRKKIAPQDVTALILCGGGSRRMNGQDKGLMTFQGQPMIQCSIDRLSASFPRLLISSNRHLEQYASLGHPVIQDETADLGPLGGILSAMKQVNTNYLLLSPCDTPFISPDIDQKLVQALESVQADIAVAHDGQRLQMLHALLNLQDNRLEISLQEFLKTEKSVRDWYRKENTIEVDCSALAKQFSNINSPEDLEKLANGDFFQAP